MQNILGIHCNIVDREHCDTHKRLIKFELFFFKKWLLKGIDFSLKNVKGD